MSHTATVQAKTTTPDGRPAFLVECTCTTHPEGMTKAIVVGPLDGSPYPAGQIHGAVLGAHHPAIGPALRAKGTIFKAA